MKKGEHNTTLGRYIRTRRLSRCLDINTVAEHSGFHPSYWRKLEAGHYQSPDAKHLVIIAETLSCPLADLYGLCGYALADELPSFVPYLRSTTNLTSEQIAAMDSLFHTFAAETDRRSRSKP